MLRLSLWLCLFTALAVQAFELIATPAQYLIPLAKTPIVIDGKLNEWDLAHTPYTFSADGKNPKNEAMTSIDWPVKGDADISGRAALAWDAENLYVAGSFTDDYLVGIKPNSYGNQGPAGWFCDALMFGLASARQPLKTNTPFQPTPFIGLRFVVNPGSRGTLVPDPQKNILDKRDLYWITTEHAKYVSVETEKGYDVEAAIPWRDLEFTARPGERFYFNFLLADTDPGRDLKQIGWGFAMDSVKNCPTFRLDDGSNALGLLTAGSDDIAGGQPLAVRAEVDALKGATRLKTVRLVDGKGKKTLATVKVNADVPQGKTGMSLLNLPTAAVAKPQACLVEAVADSGAGDRVVASVPVTIFPPKAPAEAGASAVTELHHMGPVRTVQTALSEPRHAPVQGKQDYLDYIKKHIEPGCKGNAKNFINMKYPSGWPYMLHCVAMYKITGDAEYADLGRQIMDYTLDSGAMGWFQLTAICQYRYLTWMKDPNSPLAPKDAEKRFRANLAKVAAKPEPYLFTESGTHNRVWMRYQLLKMARIVAEQDKLPIDPRVIDYTDYHDKIIGQVGDADDASAGYHWVFFDAAIGLYFFTGDWDAFLKVPGYRKTINRYVEMVTPSGACPQFASCNGWNMVGESMWVYELMSAITKDGRYRWTSHRIAEYLYNHLYERANQYHLPYDEARNNFVLAYLFADDTVKPVPPAPGSRLTWRHPMKQNTPAEMRARPGTWYYGMDATKWIPDKVVLSSGNGANDLWGLVELLPMAGHGGELPGSLLALVQNDAALLVGQGYYENTPDFQNTMWVEDLDGLPADPRLIDTTVPIFTDDSAFTFVRVKTDRYQHMPVTYTRDLFFLKNGFVVTKDRVKFNTTMKTRLGPCVQTRDLGPQCGENWFNTYYDELYYTGLGLGRGVQVIKNPAWDLLVYFSPRAQYNQTMVDRFSENAYRCSPVQMRQAWSGMAQNGQELTFTTVLLPHAPVMAPKDLLAPPADAKDVPRIEVVRDDKDVTVLKVISEASGPASRKVTYLMLNSTGDVAATDALQSDGSVAVIVTNRDGKVIDRAVAGGSLLTFQGKNESAAARQVKLAAPVMPEWLLK
jgi:hypothetical protein